MIVFLAALIASILTANGQPPVQNDDPLVHTLADIAMQALAEAHPECTAPEWEVAKQHGANPSTYIYAISAACEWSASFEADGSGWTFRIEGA